MHSPADKHATSRATKPASEFERYDRCRFAVILAPPLRGEALIGTAHFQRDDFLGNILRISLETDDPGSPAIIVAENEWKGLITRGRSDRCDYILMLTPESSGASR